MEAETEAVTGRDGEREEQTTAPRPRPRQEAQAALGRGAEGRGEMGCRGSPAVRRGAFIEEAAAAGGSRPAGPGKPPGLRGAAFQPKAGRLRPQRTAGCADGWVLGKGVGSGDLGAGRARDWGQA